MEKLKKELEADNDNIIMEGNKACENYEINIDYDSMGIKIDMMSCMRLLKR